MEQLYRKYRDRAGFFVVYDEGPFGLMTLMAQMAQADKRLLKGKMMEPAQVDFRQRAAKAQQLARNLKTKRPMLVSISTSDTAFTAYGSPVWVIAREGKDSFMAVKGAHPTQIEAVLREVLSAK